MADRIHLSVITPDGTALERYVEYINLPTERGSVGILANHAPLLCNVGRGTLRWRSEDGATGAVHLERGIANIASNEATVLVSGAEVTETTE